LEKRAEKVFPGSQRLWGGKGGGRIRGEKWPKHCMHM
jgi:hypothetical protein